VLALGILTVRYLGPVRALLDARQRLQAVQHDVHALTKHPDQRTLTHLQGEIRAAADDLGPKSQQLANGFELSALTHLPWISGQVRAVRAMRASAASAVDLGQQVVPLAQSVVTEPSDGGPNRFENLVKALDPGLMDRVGRTLHDLEGQLTAASAASLPWPLSDTQAQLVRDGRAAASSGSEALRDGQALQTALGPGDHRYLVLLGNPAEIRPGGGFIGLMGLVEARDGRIITTHFFDPNVEPANAPVLRAPRPLDQHLFLGRRWTLPDTNWSADFPTSAKEVSSFYQHESGTDIQGVVSLSTATAGELLRIVGQIQVPGYTQVVTPANIVRELSDIANHVRPGDPGKAYLTAFGGQLLQRVLHAGPAQLPKIGQALAQSADHRDLVMWFRDPGLQQRVADASATGALVPVAGTDQLQVTNANIGGGKNDLFVKKASALTVTVAKDGRAQHHLELSYTQPRPRTAEERGLQPGGGGAYRDYIEVRVPAGAMLTQMTLTTAAGKHPSGPEAIETDHGFQSFSYFLILSPGASATVSFDYSTVTPFSKVLWRRPIQALPQPVALSVKWANGQVETLNHSLDRDLSVN
jgi:hypothetical protein